MYALVVLLNINVAMATYGLDVKLGYQSVTDAFFGTGDVQIQDKYVNSLYMSIGLGMINFMGYVVITAFLGRNHHY